MNGLLVITVLILIAFAFGADSNPTADLGLANQNGLSTGHGIGLDQNMPQIVLNVDLKEGANGEWVMPPIVIPIRLQLSIIGKRLLRTPSNPNQPPLHMAQFSATNPSSNSNSEYSDSNQNSNSAPATGQSSDWVQDINRAVTSSTPAAPGTQWNLFDNQNQKSEWGARLSDSNNDGQELNADWSDAFTSQSQSFNQAGNGTPAHQIPSEQDWARPFAAQEDTIVSGFTEGPNNSQTAVVGPLNARDWSNPFGLGARTEHNQNYTGTNQNNNNGPQITRHQTQLVPNNTVPHSHADWSSFDGLPGAGASSLGPAQTVQLDIEGTGALKPAGNVQEWDWMHGYSAENEREGEFGQLAQSPSVQRQSQNQASDWNNAFDVADQNGQLQHGMVPPRRSRLGLSPSGSWN